MRTPTVPEPRLALRAGEALVRQGDPVPCVWVVESGALRESCLSEDGRELASEVLGAGDLAGWVDADGSPVTVRALKLSRLRRASPDEAAGLRSARERRTLQLACDLAWLDVGRRVERRLHDLAARFGREVSGGVLVDLRLSHEDLAALTGTTRESVSRALAALERGGRLRRAGRGRYVVRPPLAPMPSAR